MRNMRTAVPAFTRPYRLSSRLARPGGFAWVARTRRLEGSRFRKEYVLSSRPARLGGAGAGRVAARAGCSGCAVTKLPHYGNGTRICGICCAIYSRRYCIMLLRSERGIGPRVVETLVFFLCFSVGFTYETRVNCTFDPRTTLCASRCVPWGIKRFN